MTTLCDFFDDVVAVKEQADGVANFGLSHFCFNSGEVAARGQDVCVNVPANIVGADLALNEELIGIFLP